VSSAAAQQILKQIGAANSADHIILDIQHVPEGTGTGNQSVSARRDAAAFAGYQQWVIANFQAGTLE
jgi:hypothetical protein